MAQYQAYTADTQLKTAVKLYTKKTGNDANIIVVPDWYEVSTIPDGVTLLSSSNCSMVMITDENESEFETMETTAITSRVSRAGELTLVDNAPTKSHRRAAYATCPHCKNTIRDWTVLGHYWGKGLPPYWEVLAKHIFKRDKYRCAMCGDTFDYRELDAHHIIPRDKGGQDASDNLITLCEGCHDWLHDFYEAIEERTGKPIRVFEPVMKP